jgi:GNAT superfamily N-acetyltransferase
MATHMKFAIRPAEADDEAFIYATWLHGLRHGNTLFGKTKKDSFYDNYSKVIGLYLSRATVKVLCLADDEDVILGYSVYRGTTLDWVFVKKSWRRLGLAKQLIPQGIKSVTHLTEIGESLKPKEWQYDPFI